MENQDIMTMIDFTANSEYTKATEIFNDMLATRTSDAMDAMKIGLAGEVFNDVEDEQLEMEFDDEIDEDDAEALEDPSDEEINAMADEMDDNPE